MMTKTAELLNVLHNEEIIEALGEVNSVDEALELLKINGLEMTAEEFKAAAEELVSSKEGELNEEDLDAVAGGAGWGRVIRVIWWIARTLII